MRLRRRRLSESVGVLIIPVICITVTSYFGYNAVMGPRGVLAWTQTEADLAIAQRDLAKVRAEREALQHRIALLDDKKLDPDLLEEVARGLLLQGRPSEVAIPREKH
jgi:cell division protein FtsB